MYNLKRIDEIIPPCLAPLAPKKQQLYSEYWYTIFNHLVKQYLLVNSVRSFHT